MPAAALTIVAERPQEQDPRVLVFVEARVSCELEVLLGAEQREESRRAQQDGRQDAGDCGEEERKPRVLTGRPTNRGGCALLRARAT
jgi:hypothetical protein